MISLRFLASVVCLTVVSGSAWGQVTTGSILGEVRDSSGAAVAGAKVTVTDTQKGTTQQYTTDNSGSYYAPFLIPGTYRVSVEKEGFKRSVSADIPISVDQKARTDFTLEIGSVSETLEVTAAPPLIHTETAELGEVVTERAIRTLPLNGRNFAQLVYLVPGITPGQQGENLSGASTFNPRAASNFNALGSQANANAWLVDGIMDNEWTYNTVMVQPSVESIQEFKVLTGTFSAEFGRGAGVVTTQTKSGSNQFHGSAFEFLRNNYFDARNYFNYRGVQAQPPFRRNQYGGSLGGPIWKNHTFFFADYYGTREIKGNTFLTTVPTPLMHTGDFSELNARGVTIYDPTTTRTVNGQTIRTPFPNNTINPAQINAVSANVMSLYPLPNLPGLVNNRLDVLNRNLKDNGGNLRIDHRISDRDSLYGRFSYEKFDLFDAKGQSGCCYPTPAAAAGKFDLGPFVSGGQVTTLAASGAALNEAHIFSPTLVNELILGYARTNPFSTQSDFGHNAAQSLGINGINISQFSTGLPTIVSGAWGGVGGVQALNGGPGFLPAHPVQTSYQLQDNVSWTVNNHQLKLGYRGIQDRMSPFTNTDTRGTLNFQNALTANPVTGGGGAGWATLLLGYLDNGTGAGGSRGFLREPYYLTSWEHALWLQDDWKVNRKLTLNLGVRWEVYTAPTEERDRLTNFDFQNQTLVYAGVNGTSDTANVKTHWKNFGPRFGFAYDPTGNGRTVVRGGFGMSYFPEQASASNIIGQAVPWTISQNTAPTELYPASVSSLPVINNPFGPPVPVQPMTTAELLAANPRVLAQSYENQTPYYESWNLDIQRQFGKSYVAELAYAGSRGVHLLAGYNPVEVQPGTGPANSRVTIPTLATLRGNFLYTDPRNMSNFHSFQAKMTKRFSSGLQFLGSYTWSKSLDYSGSAASGSGWVGGPQTITNFAAAYGPSGFDVRHRFVGSWVYELPFGPGRRFLSSGILGNIVGGWEIDGIGTVSTGRPFTVYLSSSNNNATEWPDRIGSGTREDADRSHWYDPTAFVQPPAGSFRYGNEGRGVLYSPGWTNFDLSAAKNFTILENLKVQFRVDAFNTFNHPQFGNPNQTVNSSNPANSDTSITNTITDNRDLQLAVKIQF
jgi:hypothetical protein